MKRAITLLLLAICFCSCAKQHNTLSLRQQVAQMVMVGFQGTDINNCGEIVQVITNEQIGGIILFDYSVPTHSRPRNIVSPEQTSTLVAELQKLSQAPLFVAIDEEGGQVSRLKKRYGFLPTVTPQYLGNINNEDTTRFYARRIAVACRKVGVNINFAPSVDVNVNPDCPIIGKLDRSFSSNAEGVIKHASWFVSEHQKVGVGCAIKHFPGHGSSLADSHLGLTDVTQTWTRTELKPFEALLAEPNCPMLMTSHIFNAKLDSIYPATLSKRTLSIVRDSIGYNGLIFSDDMMMNAISKCYGLEEAVFRAIDAGVDVLIFSNNIDEYNANIAHQVIELIMDMVADGRISKERIAQSVERIMLAKQVICASN